MPVPAGYTLDTATAPKLPPGYTLDAPAASAPAGMPKGMALPGLSAHAPIQMESPYVPPIPSLDGVKAAGRTLLNMGKGALKSLPATAAGFMGAGPGGLGGGVAPIGTNNDVQAGAPDASALLAKIGTPNGTAQTVGKALGSAAQFLAPSSLEGEAGGALAPLVGRYLPAAKLGIAAASSGLVNKAQGGTFTGGAVAGGIGSGLTQGLQKVAPTLAETALNVTGLDRLYGRTVGRAILDDTVGLKPKNIVSSAQGTMASLSPQLETLADSASANGSRGSLLPARAGVAGRINSFLGNRAVNSAEELQPLQSFLQKDAVTGLPLGASQTPAGLLNMKRGLDADFIGNWNPTRNTNSQLNAAKGAYGSLANEFHNAAPGTGDLDQRISSLFPVIKRAGAADLNAGILQRSLGKLGKPTGALVGSLAGAGAGYKSDGAPGALVGGIAGLAAPEILASPTTMMLGARVANSGLLPSATRFGTGLLMQPSKLKRLPVPDINAN